MSSTTTKTSTAKTTTSNKGTCNIRFISLVIVNKADGSKVLRYAMGNSGLKICKNAIGLDYDAVDALNVSNKQEVDLEVRRAKRWEIWHWYWQHPDQSVQLSIKLGVAGAVLGVMGFLTGVAPYILG